MKKISYILLCMFLSIGCDDMSFTVDLDLPAHDPQLVVNALFEVDQPHSKVYLTHSIAPESNSSYNYIKDAVVLLKQNEQVIDDLQLQLDEVFDNDSSFCYLSDYTMQANTTYQLEVKHPTYPTALAQMTTLPGVKIESVILGEVMDYQRNLRFTINDPPAEDNFYLLRLKFKAKETTWEEDYPEWMGLWFESNDPSFTENDDFWEDQYDGRKVLFNDQLFNGNRKTFSVEVEYWNEIDSLQVILYSVSEDYYKYHQSRRLQNQDDGATFLGAEPVVVYNNIHNGFGIFASRSVEKVKLSVADSSVTVIE